MSLWSQSQKTSRHLQMNFALSINIPGLVAWTFMLDQQKTNRKENISILNIFFSYHFFLFLKMSRALLYLCMSVDMCEYQTTFISANLHEPDKTLTKTKFISAIKWRNYVILEPGTNVRHQITRDESVTKNMIAMWINASFKYASWNIVVLSYSVQNKMSNVTLQWLYFEE